jgi:uncharacterized RDD family membrane protein YckC
MKEKIFIPNEIERLQALEGVRLANFRQRAFAFIIDLFICFFLFLVTLFIAGIFLWYKATGGSFTTYSFTFDIFSWYGKLVLNILIPILYFGLSTYLSNGKTIGKKIMKIRVISLVNEKITLWNSIERSLGYGASIFELGIGFFQYFFHPNCRTSHDCLAETIVIRE